MPAGRWISGVLFRSDWPLDKVLWWYAHHLAGYLVARWGYEKGWDPGMRGSVLHLNNDHWTVRLAHYCGDHWIDWWIRRSVER